MSRRKPLARRTSSGNVVRKVELTSPAEVRRLYEQARVGLRDAAWGSEIGRLYLTGKISSTEFSAGKRWAIVSANYSIASRSPQGPRSVSLEGLPGGSSTDPDTESGEREARRHERACCEYITARDVLRRVGAELIVDHVCVKECAAIGVAELKALRDGLSALASAWAKRNKQPKPSRSSP